MERIDVSRRTIGINIQQDGTASVRVWSPLANSIGLKISGRKISLEKQDYGYWHLHTDEISLGDRYTFLIDEEKEYPDPASLSQPDGVHGPSVVVDLTRFTWSDKSWKNISLGEYIIYELHTGTFSDQGNFGGIEQRLAYLKELGITAIEVMPVSQFPGDRNWGYDGVFPFAVQNSYGGAEALMHLVDLCHREGIAVVLDIVYNHVGPEGNYFGEFGPYFTR